MENQNNNIMQTQNTNNTSTIDESIGYIKNNNIFNKNHSDDSFFLDIEKDIHINKDTIRQKLSEKRRIGNVCAFFYKDGEPRIIIGPHWPFFACLITFINTICFLYFYNLWNSLNDLVKYLGLIVYLIQITSYTYTVVINPGLVKKDMSLSFFQNSDKKKNLKNFRICNKCQVIMDLDEHTVHCEDCNVCIEGHDHHCPWTTKCVGKGNLKSFYIFVAFTFVLMGFLLFGVATLPHN